ncbi:hypothetical protein KUTeg_010973 [Tegillarca granosa]|uniref:C2H2-type domain-containing protein n=1 Tax=Tegillarca granosa TaxID=220873 RepID=A0ABQ9F2J5_TEGGR|nr:hypothetical protein KUTeg_010973 [Tegillarca granosa]
MKSDRLTMTTTMNFVDVDTPLNARTYDTLGTTVHIISIAFQQDMKKECKKGEEKERIFKISMDGLIDFVNQDIAHHELFSDCDELSRYGEESAVLVVNPNNNVTGCMGSRFGQEFFQSKLDLLQQFHQYCQELMTKHTCNVCNESFTKPKGLSRHRVNQGHAQPCEICGTEFIHTPEFRNHMRHHKAQQKKLEKIPVKCEFCPKEFWGKGDLNKHRRIHTKEKPYMCDVCGSQFALPSQLSCHRRSHTGERPYSCTECGKKFTLSNTLARHRRKHSGDKYQCHICGKQYASRWNLTVHVEYIHTGLTPFKCEFCGKEFNRKDNLKVHKKKHDKERAKASNNTTMVPNSDVSADMYLTGLVERTVQGISDVGLSLGPKSETHISWKFQTESLEIFKKYLFEFQILAVVVQVWNPSHH